MRSAKSILFMAFLLAAPAARAALTPEGGPLMISGEFVCGAYPGLGVAATPKGAFEVIWVDDGEHTVKSRRFARDLAANPPVELLSHGFSTVIFDPPRGVWAAGRYEWAINGQDYGADEYHPWVSYRIQLDAEGNLLAPAARILPFTLFELTPAKGGESLRLRIELPYFRSGNCRSAGLLGGRVGLDGSLVSKESRITAKAPGWGSGGPGQGRLAADRLPDDSFVVAYTTCEKFLGVVVRPLTAAGVPVGKPYNLQLPVKPGAFIRFGIPFAARGPADFAVAAEIGNQANTAILGEYTFGVVGGKIFGPTRLTTGRPVDLAASSNGYLLLSLADGRLFAQELDLKGVPRGAAVAVSGEAEEAREGAAASLPDGRWIVVSRTMHGEGEACREQVLGTVFAGE
jgi:hypothetical protein